MIQFIHLITKYGFFIIAGYSYAMFPDMLKSFKRYGVKAKTVEAKKLTLSKRN